MLKHECKGVAGRPCCAGGAEATVYQRKTRPYMICAACFKAWADYIREDEGLSQEVSLECWRQGQFGDWAVVQRSKRSKKTYTWQWTNGLIRLLSRMSTAPIGN